MRTLLAPSLLASSLIASSLLVGALGCTAPALTPTTSDRAPELSLTRARVLDTFAVEGEYLVSTPLVAPELATRVAVMLDVEPDARHEVTLQARAIGLDGAPGPWRTLEVTWAEHPSSVLRVDFARTAQAAQLRIRVDEIDDVSWLLFSTFVPAQENGGPTDAQPGAALLDDASTNSATDSATDSATNDSIGLAAPSSSRLGLLAGVNPRSSWNARAATCSTSENYKTRITVHHTVTYPDSGGSYEARIRAIQAFHMDGRGYCDIAYHVMVTLDGQLWEARPETVRGGHTGGQNTGNLGVSLIGCFHPTADCSGIGPNDPSASMVGATALAIGTAAVTFGIDISSDTVMGHRDNPGQSTACPGDNVHGQLAAIRVAAQGGGVSPTPATGRALGTVWDLSLADTAADSTAAGARIVGATVTVDGQSETLTDDDTLWAFDLAPGTYTVTAQAPGFTTTTRDVTVTAGADQWASIGLSPAATSATVTVHVYNADNGPGDTIEGASVQVSGADAQLTDDLGKVEATVAAGEVTLVVEAEGYERVVRTLLLAAGVPRTEQVGLLPVVVAPPEEDPPVDEPPADDPPVDEPPVEEPPTDEPPLEQESPDLLESTGTERVSLTQDGSAANGGCSSTDVSGDSVPTSLLAILLLPALLRRRRR